MNQAHGVGVDHRMPGLLLVADHPLANEVAGGILELQVGAGHLYDYLWPHEAIDAPVGAGVTEAALALVVEECLENLPPHLLAGHVAA